MTARRPPTPMPRAWDTGSKWDVTPDALRHRARRDFSLPPDVLAHLDALPPRTASTYVEACIRVAMVTEASASPKEPDALCEP